MRTFILSIISLLTFSLAQAQTTDIETLILSPEPGFDITENDTFAIIIGVRNNGNTVIESTDSIYLTFYIDENLISTQEGSSFLMRRPNADSTAQTEIAVGDTAIQIINLVVPSAYIPLFTQDLICFTAELFHANSNVPVLESNTENNKGCNAPTPVGIEEFEHPVEVFNGNQSIQIHSKIQAKFELYDLFGRLVSTQHLNPGKQHFDLSSLPKAVYFYKVTDGNNVLQTGKVLN